MKVKLIYNPISGDRTFKNHLDYIIDKFQQKGMQIEPYRTNRKEELDKMISQMDGAEYKKILIAGGDGTINQVVNSLLRYNIDLPIGIFPVGTANDYAQYFNLPQGIEEIVEILLRDNYTLSDVGLVNDRYFINVASLGVLIDISQKTNTELKNSLGVLAYYLNGITELPKVKPVNIKVNSSTINYDGEILFMLIMNGRSAGGFHKIAPTASINDGLLDVFIFKKCPIYELAALLLTVINGEHINNSNVIHFKTEDLFIDTLGEVSTDLDGEGGPVFPLNLRIIPQKLKIITRYNNEDGSVPQKNLELHHVRKAFQQISKGFVNEIQKHGETKSERKVMDDLRELFRNLPRHNTFSYVNKGSLSEDFFRDAEKTLDNGYLYIVLSSTGSAAGETIAKVTNKSYSHSALSFDEDLNTIISYNGGEKIYSPGLNLEMLEFFYQKEDANILIYRIEATYEQKKQVLEYIRKINQEGSSYNVLGLVLPYSHKDNIMFCSQFVYNMLRQAGLAYFDKRSESVKPTDFVELDYERRLEFCGKVVIKDAILGRK